MPLHAAVHAAGSADVDADTWNALYHSSGAVLIGGLVALFLSGAVLLQVALYFQTYPTDPKKVKAMVALIWILDCVHSAMVGIANWENLILGFGKFDGLDGITWSIAMTVALTATTTFLVHCFFSYRIHTLSRGNWYITAPLYTLALIRLVSAMVSTVEMLRLKSFSAFVDKFSYVFTLGLSTSTSLDILITGILCYYLRQRKSGLARMDQVIAMLTIYTVENGMLTCITTAVSLVCWLAMPHNLIFLGLHLAISKMYANSFLASLNARRALSNRSQGSNGQEGYPMPVLLHSPFTPRLGEPWSPGGRSVTTQKPLHVNIEIEQTVHPEVYEGSQEADPECLTPREDLKHN